MVGVVVVVAGLLYRIDELGLVGGGDGWIESNRIKSNHVRSNRLWYMDGDVAWHSRFCSMMV